MMGLDWKWVVVCFCTLSFASSAEEPKLTIYHENDGILPIHETSDEKEVEEILKTIDVRFGKWKTHQLLSEISTPEEVIAAYQNEIDQLIADDGYQTVDVLSIHPSHPELEKIREEFKSEQSLSEDEVCLFVSGAAAFYFHKQALVYMVRLEAGDLIAIPADDKHWFDMGLEPKMTLIRFFVNSNGRGLTFTGSAISENFPEFFEE